MAATARRSRATASRKAARFQRAYVREWEKTTRRKASSLGSMDDYLCCDGALRAENVMWLDEIMGLDSHDTVEEFLARQCHDFRALMKDALAALYAKRGRK